MIEIIRLIAGAMFRVFQSRRTLLFKNLAFRQQLFLGAQESQAEADRIRQILLGCCPAILVRWETGLDCCGAGSCGAIAQSWIRSVLAADLKNAPSSRQEAHL